MALPSDCKTGMCLDWCTELPLFGRSRESPTILIQNIECSVQFYVEPNRSLTPVSPLCNYYYVYLKPKRTCMKLNPFPLSLTMHYSSSIYTPNKNIYRRIEIIFQDSNNPIYTFPENIVQKVPFDFLGERVFVRFLILFENSVEPLMPSKTKLGVGAGYRAGYRSGAGAGFDAGAGLGSGAGIGTGVGYGAGAGARAGSGFGKAVGFGYVGGYGPESDYGAGAGAGAGAGEDFLFTGPDPYLQDLPHIISTGAAPYQAGSRAGVGTGSGPGSAAGAGSVSGGREGSESCAGTSSGSKAGAGSGADEKSIQANSMLSFQTDVECLSLDVGELLKTGDHSDVQLQCKGGNIPAHKAILAARSKTFSEMLSENTEENKKGLINMSTTELSVMELCLEFIYKGKILNLPSEMASNLYVLGHVLKISSLTKMCADHMVGNVSEDNYITYLVLADKYDDDYFKGGLIDFIFDHTHLLKSESWRKFSYKYQETAMDRYQKYVMDFSFKHRFRV